MLDLKASLVKLNSKASDILKHIFSQALTVKYNFAFKICFVAVLEFAAASFCNPTNDCLSGNVPSLASLSPVTSLIICK